MHHHIFWRLVIAVFLALNAILALRSHDSSKPGTILAGAVSFSSSR
ncbi:MAG: hypothetical protein HY077_06885 [Elusimicrobia bacterium]|nr:hypothetical protein [Elusimicrobiota bacterium]